MIKKGKAAAPYITDKLFCYVQNFPLFMGNLFLFYNSISLYFNGMIYYKHTNSFLKFPQPLIDERY